MRKITVLSVLALMACSVSVRAQFYSNGTESTGIRWRTISSPNYRFVYPEGCDSLAHSYALEWERVRAAVGFSTGMLPNEAYRKRMPVILHPYLGYSNGTVVWTPRRMEMYTGPDMYSPDPIPWMTILAIHENRHVSQFQYVNKGWMHGLGWLTGEIPAGLAMLYTEPSFLEGDAVAAETGLTASGRGRTADFLEYYRASLDEGERRSYARWRFGSQKLFTPDYYKVGYLAMGGLRAYCGVPDIVSDYLYATRRYTSGCANFGYAIKRATGSSFNDNFELILDRVSEEWKQDADSRAPFMASEPITFCGDHYIDYYGLVSSDGRLFAVKAGMTDINKLVELDVEERTERVLHDCGASSRLAVCGNRILWTAVKYDRRWEMESGSELKYVALDGSRGLLGFGVRTLVGGRSESGAHVRLFNPSVHADSLIAVCSSPADGSYAVELYSSEGALLQQFVAPSGLQPYECAFVGEDLYVAALSAEGEGIYRLDCSCGHFAEVLKPSPIKINHLGEHRGMLTFTSDRNGVNELYALDAAAGLSASDNVARVFQLTNLRGGGKDFVFMDGFLYYTVLSTSGRMIYRTPVDVLHAREVDFTARHRYELADRLTSLEEGAWDSASEDATSDCDSFEPKRYVKPLHALKIHSWLPFYVDADDLTSLSLSSVTSTVSLGASVMFQNDLNTLSGSAGYCYGKGLATHFTYSGLYPVFEVKFSSGMDFVSPSGSVRTYIPINFSSDGWRRAIIPHMTVSYSGSPVTSYSPVLNDNLYVSGGVRAYAVQAVPSSCIYPKWGVGAEAGMEYGRYMYGLLYGYVPGFYETHGIGCQAYYEGVSGSLSLLVQYAMPILPVDWDALSPFVYLRNFELKPFWSFNHSVPLESFPLNYHTVGTSFTAVLGNLWFIPYTVHVGVQYSYKIDMFRPHTASMVFTIDM